MKKIGLSLAGIIVIAVIYYFTAGSEKLTNEMKVRVNTELTQIQQNGFAVQQREVKEREEHFILTFDDPEKIVSFFKKQGSEITLEDAKTLQGFKIGVDLKYLNSSYAALSADIYPLNLPPALNRDPQFNENDKARIKQLNDMLKRKVLLVHVDFNKLLSGFKGYSKDIHETFIAENPVKLDIEGNTFEGDIQNDRINNLTQKVKILHLKSSEALEIRLNNLENHYEQKGDSLYDTVSHYKAADISLATKADKELLAIGIKNITGENITSVANKLASNQMTFKADEIEIKQNAVITKLSQNTFTWHVKNIDIAALEKLEKLDVNDQIETDKLVQGLLSKGVSMSIPLLEVKKIFYKGQELDGFSLNSTFQINKSASLSAIQANPFAALSAINTKTEITLSDALFALIAQDPRAMMFAMLLPPKVVNGQKTYQLELKEGKLFVNGKPML